MPIYSMGIKKSSPLYQYISSVHIGFQDLTTSLNAIIYTVALNEKLVESLNQIFINHIGDFYYMHCGNLKWYEFYKMGWGNYSGHVYKRTFINDCIQGIKWNVIHLIKKDITIYLISNKMTVLPSANVYKTNINGNSNTEFWNSINIYSPNFCDFIKDYGACVNWSNESHTIDCYYTDDNKLMFKRYGLPMDIRYYYSRFMVIDSIIDYTYELIGKSMEKIDKYKAQHASLRVWLKFKADMEKEVLYFQRFYNEQSEQLYDTDDFGELFAKKGSKLSISENLLGNKRVRVKAASDALDQMIEYIDSNIDYRSANENYRMQRITGLIGFWSMIIAAVAMIATCMGNTNVVNFFENNLTKITWIIVGLTIILLAGKIFKFMYFKFKR